ncbi:hypothetical protein SAMD00024442_1_33 [Candidatus Symbiothrix dinenymphae]|nr:hypothetical protein SAMD00024442_1_33 [Candidatus Symbiothrix dinenymphae]
MSTEKFQNQYRLKSARAEWHDYGGGTYFITVCTAQREHFFGEIVDGQMQLSPIGEYLSENLQNVAQHYSYAEMPLYVIMPNHWHAIVFIDGEKTPQKRNSQCRDVACHVSDAGLYNNSDNVVAQMRAGDVARHVSTNETMIDIRAMKGWLSVAIGGVKSAVTKYANGNKIDFAWQPRFHDHIIRDTEEINRIADYIENNPATWDIDCFNK